MADPAPMERHMPVGYRFHPTDQELVGHYLRHKLMADDPSIHETVPEFGVCEYEPQDLLARVASAVPATKFDDFQCYFFSPRDYKDSKGKRLNRTTSGGFWKVTGEDGIIINRDTNNIIGKKKHLVYYKGRGGCAHNTNWVIHEYYDDQLSSEQNTHVLCWLKKKDGKKIKEQTHKEVTNKRKSTFSNVNQINMCMDPNESYSSNLNSMIQPPSKINKTTDSMIQLSSHSNEATDSMIQLSSHSNEATDSMIQLSSHSNEVTIDSMIQPPSYSNEATDSMIQPASYSNEATDSMIQPSSHSNEVIYSIIQPPFQLNEVTDLMIHLSSQPNEVTHSIIQQASQVDEAMNSIDHTSLEPNFADETFGGEFHFSLFDQGGLDLASFWQLPPTSSRAEQELFESMATSDMNWPEA